MMFLKPCRPHSATQHLCLVWPSINGVMLVSNVLCSLWGKKEIFCSSSPVKKQHKIQGVCLLAAGGFLFHVGYGKGFEKVSGGPAWPFPQEKICGAGRSPCCGPRPMSSCASLCLLFAQFKHHNVNVSVHCAGDWCNLRCKNQNSI